MRKRDVMRCLWVGLLVTAGAGCSSCARNATNREANTGPDQRVTPAAELSARSEPAESSKVVMPCSAGKLPRFTEQNLAEGQGRALVAAAETGTVAVVWNGERLEVVTACKLAGRYIDIPSKTGTGHFRPTDRAIFRTDEAAGECRRATHVVGAFATGGFEAVGASKGPAGGAEEPRVAGVLVPLPCPPATDPNPAAGCIAKGMTGAERRARAQALMTQMSPVPAAQIDVSISLEIFALLPDELDALMYLASLRDGTLSKHGLGVALQYKSYVEQDPRLTGLLPGVGKPQPEEVYWNPKNSQILKEPLFLWCFPDRVNPNIRFITSCGGM